MTSDSFNTNFPPLYIPRPFASGSGAAYTAVQNSTVSNAVNFDDGFPELYATPPSNNGKLITRGEMNAIGRIGTQNQFRRAMGGIITFDPALAIKHGGYPKYAVLEYLNGLNYYRVISKVDNNKVDFTGRTPTSSEAAQGIVAGSVDGINWAYCEQGWVSDNPDPTQTIIEYAEGVTLGTSGYYDQTPIAAFTSKGGYITIRGGVNLVSGTAYDPPSGDKHESLGVVIMTTTSNPRSTEGQLVFFNGGRWPYDASTSGIYYDKTGLAMVNTTVGTTYYAWLITNGQATVNAGGFKVYVQ